MNNTNNALETLVQRDKQIKKTNDKLKASINELDAELESTTNAISTHASNTDIHTSKEELIKFIVDHLESLDLGITKEVVSVLPTENISDNTLYFVPNDKGSHNEYLYINDMWELVGSTETNFTDYYTKLETDTLLEGKANSVHNHVVSDITDFPTIPTRTSQLINDSGFLTSSSGVITSVSWSDITNKPNFATVATSGSYTDLSNTPTIPTKVSQLENDTGFVSGLTDVVDTKSNQTINGVKTFTSGPWVTNNQTTMGFSIKNTAIARNEVPSQLYHATFRAYDKNAKILGEYCVEKSTTGCTLLNMNVRSEDSNGKQLSESLYLNMSNDGSAVRFYPSSNNKVDLGMSGNKWGKVYSDDVVHTSGNETINGNKTFTNQLYLGAGGGSYGLISAKDNNSILRLFGGTSAGTGANLDLYGEGLNDGGFSLRARTSNKIVGLDGKTDGTLKWNGKNVAIDENLVHTSGTENISGTKMFSNTIHRYADLTTSGYAQVYRFDDTNANACGHIYNSTHWSGDSIFNRHGAYNNKSGKTMEIDIISPDSGFGMAYVSGTATKGNVEAVTSATDHTGIATMGWVNNPATSTNVVHRSGDETIEGNKFFTQDVNVKNGNVDIAVTPSNNLFSCFRFRGKGNVTTASLQYSQRTYGVNDLCFYVFDADSNSHGFRIRTDKRLEPIENNTYSLGSSSSVWANVYAARINCDNIVKTVENSYIYMTAGPGWNNGASIFLNGKSGDGNGSGAGTFTLYARNTTAERYLLGRPDGILKWTGCIEAHEMRSTTGNAFMAQNGGYTFLIRNDGSNTYFLMSDKDGVPGTWSTARPLIINNATGVCNINGNANSAYYSETPATTDNSTRIATTAWVRNYVNSVAGSNTVGSSVSAYWSNSSNVTATGQASSGGHYPECYSEYVSKTPVVGTIYSGAQLYTVLNTYASAKASTTGSPGSPIYVTNTTAQATLSNPLSSTAKYLCTTANTFSFRAHTASGNTSSVGASSVVNATLTKSIFIRVQ